MMKHTALPLLKKGGLELRKSFSQLPKLNDLQVAVTLLCMCGAYNKLARCTPSDLAT